MAVWRAVGPPPAPAGSATPASKSTRGHVHLFSCRQLGGARWLAHPRRSGSQGVEATARAATALDNEAADPVSVVGVDDRHQDPDHLPRSAAGRVPPPRSNIRRETTLARGPRRVSSGPDDSGLAGGRATGPCAWGHTRVENGPVGFAGVGQDWGWCWREPVPAWDQDTEKSREIRAFSVSRALPMVTSPSDRAGWSPHPEINPMDEHQESSPFLPLPRKLLDRGDLAEMFGVTRETIRDWQKRGLLPGPIVVGTKPLWRAEAIAALLEGGVM
jgi:hypothetical protein